MILKSRVIVLRTPFAVFPDLWGSRVVEVLKIIVLEVAFQLH